MYPTRSYSLRKQQRNPMLMAKELPEDLVTQILLWLPVVSLLRFKCVCKSWYALITHQNFITKHLYNKNNKNNNTLLLLKMFDKTTKSYVVSTLSYETLQVSLTQPLPPPSFWVNKKGHISIVGSCNGLVCLHDEHGENVVIWNPATKETKVVPKSNMPHFPACHDSRIYGTGFGFDAKTNDYKIINLISLCESNSINGEKIVLSEIYSLSADSWRKVDSPLYFDIYDRHSFCYISYNLSLNGMFSWRIWAGNWDGVLSFDMSNEVFIKTLLPDGVIAASFQDLFVLKESIAMVVSIWDDEECSEITRFQIWLLLEVGVKDSWTKLITVGPFTGIERNLGFWNNETMLLEKHDRQLVLYEPSTKEMIDLPIHYAGRHSFPLVTFMETLVSVKGGNEFEDEQNSC